MFRNKDLKNKGFTLLELLAVIVILAVIALIAVPLILNLIDKFRKNSFKETANQIYEAGEKYLTVELKGKKDKCVYFDFSKDYSVETVVDNKTYIPLKELNLKGQLPVSGILAVCNGEVNASINNGDTTLNIDNNKNIRTEPVIPDKSYKGKWVDYTPDNATWDAERDGVEVTELKEQGKFNIYDKTTNKAVTGASKNNSITCYNSIDVNKYSGFRIMDVDTSGTITLIHAGTPECYYHTSGQALTSEDLLSLMSTSSNPGTGKAWTKYGNSSLAESVHYMNGTDFDTIVGKSFSFGDLTYCFYNESTVCQNNNFIDINTQYWVSRHGDINCLYSWFLPDRHVRCPYGDSRGVRPVIKLKPGIKIGIKGTGTEVDPYELSVE